MAKTAGYGMIRFLVPLFPTAASTFTPWALAIGVIGVLYGAVLAFSQRDLKRLIAYSSISHMSMVVLGVFAWNELALQGATLQLVAHGIATGALFALAGMLQERTGTRDIYQLGGLWSRHAPLGAAFLLFALAALGLPGLGNFVAEFLILAGTFVRSPAAASIAAVGVVTSAIYALWMIQRVFFGPASSDERLAPFSGRESLVLVALVVAIVWLGVLPGAVLDRARQGLGNVTGRAGLPTTLVQPASSPGSDLSPSASGPVTLLDGVRGKP
jgi:NADH-quinone oxidoreductase subunit M